MQTAQPGAAPADMPIMSGDTRVSAERAGAGNKLKGQIKMGPAQFLCKASLTKEM